MAHGKIETGEMDMDKLDRRCQTCRWIDGEKCNWPVPIWLERFLEMACYETQMLSSYRHYGVPGEDCPTWEPKEAGNG